MTERMKKMRDEFIKDCGVTLGTDTAGMLQTGFDACYAIMQKRIKELEEHLGDRNKAEVWASTNVILSEDW